MVWVTQVGPAHCWDLGSLISQWSTLIQGISNWLPIKSRFDTRSFYCEELLTNSCIAIPKNASSCWHSFLRCHAINSALTSRYSLEEGPLEPSQNYPLTYLARCQAVKFCASDASFIALLRKESVPESFESKVCNCRAYLFSEIFYSFCNKLPFKQSSVNATFFQMKYMLVGFSFQVFRFNYLFVLLMEWVYPAVGITSLAFQIVLLMDVRWCDQSSI